MLGRLFSDEVIDLEVQDADFLLRLASRGDYLNWRRARAENHAFLQPYEPVWADDALDEDRYRMMVRDARRAFRYQSGAVMFLIHKDEGECFTACEVVSKNCRFRMFGSNMGELASPEFHFWKSMYCGLPQGQNFILEMKFLCYLNVVGLFLG